MGVHCDPSASSTSCAGRDLDRDPTRRLDTEAEAVAFAGTVATREPPSLNSEPGPTAVSAAADRLQRGRRDGIYPYETERGTRSRFVFRQSDGSISSRRGFTSRRAACSRLCPAPMP
jgi:hypothetical protein